MTVSAATACSTTGGRSRLQGLYDLYYNGVPGPLRARRRRGPARRVAGARAGETGLSAALPVDAAGVTGMPFDDSDRALVGRVKQGDSSAFESLHRRYYRKLYRFAYLRTNSAEDAADIASETFCRALQRVTSYEFRRSDSLYPWLHQIASNLVIDRSRAQPAGGMLSLDAQLSQDLESFLNCLADESPSAHEILEQKEVHAAVRAAVEQLPADQGRAVTFRFFADLSIRDIAREMDRSEGAIKSLLHRALQGIRDRLRASALAAGTGVAHQHQERAASHAREVIQVRPGDAR
jgi:RNA polymerase sigma-70 factor, ECF subfamily